MFIQNLKVGQRVGEAALALPVTFRWIARIRPRPSPTLLSMAAAIHLPLMIRVEALADLRLEHYGYCGTRCRSEKRGCSANV